MDEAAIGFANKADGSGIRMYWLLNGVATGQNQIFTQQNGVAELAAWTAANRNIALKSEFVYLVLADRVQNDPDTFGWTNSHGSYVFVNSTSNQAGVWNISTNASIAGTIVHELTHLLLHDNLPGFDNSGHVPDPDPTDPIHSTLDFKYLMYTFAKKENSDKIIFDPISRGAFALSSKRSVER